jgi:diaminopimelate decarboxylase
MTPEMRAQFDYDPPSFQDYGQVVGEIFRDHFTVEGPRLLLEPGMAVVADCMKFVVEVMELKTVDDKDFVVANGSTYNIRPTFSHVNLPIEIFTPTPSQSPSSAAPADVVGYTCMEVDVLHRDLNLAVKPGDFIVFSNVGAYTVVLLPPFIRAAPAIVAFHNGSTRTSRRAQQLDDILATYYLHQPPNGPK